VFQQWPPHSANKPTNRKTSTPRLVRRFLSSSKDTIATPMRSHTPPKLKHNAVAPKHRPTHKPKRSVRKVCCRISRITFQNTMVPAVAAVTVRLTMKTAPSGRTVCT
ncbi:hypothetical protein V8G54_002798, partial [Vigna mungo]